jgi:hypothetical protein
MRYRFTAGAALLGALALSLTPALVPLPAQAGAPAPRPGPQRGPAAGPAPEAASTPAILPATKVSPSCRGQNVAPEEAADSTGRHVYVVWMGCGGIGFARSADGGLRFRRPVKLPASQGAFDPAVAVAPNGTVYAVFMKQTAHHQYPVVDTSFDHGRSFPQVARVIPKQLGNFGGRPFIAAAPNGTLYLTWDYGPSASAVSYICTKHAGCSFKTGDLNVVMQTSTDFGLTWGPMTAISPGFPVSGADSAPLLVEPDGRIDLEYQAYRVTDPVKLTLGPAHSYFTSSPDGGVTWSSPVRVGPGRLSMAPAEWWIDGSVARDSGGNLYVTWDSQRGGRDVGWLSYSADGGNTWSSPVRVTPDRDGATHIVEVAGGFRGTAYVAWLADNSRCGYLLRVRAYVIGEGWQSGPVRVSGRCGRRRGWPGGTFGITALPPATLATGAWQVALSWASAVAHRHRPPSEIFSSVVTYPGQG